MPIYQIRVLDQAYTIKTILTNQGTYGDWTNLDYRLALNDVDSCSITLVPNSSKLEECIVGRRVQVYRDCTLQFSGIISRAGWKINLDPSGDTYQIDCLGGAIYLDWRLILPASGQAYDERTDNADDLAKAYVTANASSTATVTARRFTDLTVQANAGACTSWTEQPRYDNLLTEVQKLAELGAFDWRVVPTSTGFQFQTAFPDWGLDRTWGNGVNTDAVFTVDRRNFEWMSYNTDTLDHRNYIYVLGQGEGADQTVRERAANEDISAYLRREATISGTAYEDNTALDYIGDMELRKRKAIAGLEVRPLNTTYKTPWDLGDIVTIKAARYGWAYTTEAKVMAVNITVGADGVEVVEPDMKILSNSVTNPAFADPGGGGALFDGWTDDGAAPMQEETTILFRFWTRACKVAKTVAGNCIAKQGSKPVTPSSLYRMDVWSYGNGTHQGYMKLADNVGTTVTTNLPSAATWSKTTHYLRVAGTASTVDITCGMTAAVGAYVIIGYVNVRKV